MNIIDIIILITLIPTVIVGVKKGFISQAISVLTILVGIWASSLFANPICNWLASHIAADEQILKIAAFAIIFTLVFVLLTILGKLLEKGIQATFISWLNKLLGSVMALINYALIVGVLLIAFDYINKVYGLIPASALDNSVLSSIIMDIADAIFPTLTKLLL